MGILKREILVLLAVVLLGCVFTPAAWADSTPQQNPFKGSGPWYELDEAGEVRLHLYFFWSNKCPHCKRAKPFLEKLQKEHPWVLLSEREITENPENAQRFAGMVRSIGETSRAVPALMFCGGMVQGFDREENSGVQLVNLLTRCRTDLKAYLAPPEPMPEIPAQTPPPPSQGPGLFTLLGLLTVLAVGGGLYWAMNRLKK